MDEYTGVRPHTHSHIVNTQIREHRRTHTIPHNFSSLFRVCTAAPPRVREGAARRHVDAGVGCNEDCGAVVLPERG